MIQIIKAAAEHSELIAKIGKQTFLESHGNSASKEDIDDFIIETYNINSITQEFDNLAAHYCLIYFENKLAGFSKIEFNSLNNNIEVSAITQLGRIYLLEKFHGLKLGAKLLKFNIKISKENNQKGMWLATWVENKKAISFYTKHGFQIVGKYDFRISATHSNPNHIMYLSYE